MSRPRFRHRRVLVTEGEHRGVLAACRSLSRAGCDVAVASGRRPAAALWSRACGRPLQLADPGRSPQRFVSDVAEIVRRETFDALLPGGERSLRPVSERRADLARHVRLGLPAHASVLRSLDKIALLEAADATGLASPTSVACETRSAARRAAHALGFPVLIKPRASVVPSGGSLRQLPILLAGSVDELDDALDGAALPTIVQRFEERCVHLSCAGVMTGAGLVGFVVIRFVRTWPPEVGAVSFGETVPVPVGLRPRVEELLRLLGWRGIFELELLALGGGRFAAIDLNPRVFGWLALAVAAGVDLPRVWLEWVVGGQPEDVAPRLGVRYRWEEADLAHLVWQLRRRRLRAAAAVVRPRRNVVHAHFRLADPAPLAARLLGLAQRGLHVG